MAAHAVNSPGDERVTWLNRHKPTESVTEHKHRPQPQSATQTVKCDAHPAYGLAPEGPEPRAVRIGRKKAVKQADQSEGGDYPAIAAILANARTDVPTGKVGDKHEYGGGYGEGHERWMREKLGLAAPTENS